jgi:hypothetical protein
MSLILERFSVLLLYPKMEGLVCLKRQVSKQQIVRRHIPKHGNFLKS